MLARNPEFDRSQDPTFAESGKQADDAILDAAADRLPPDIRRDLSPDQTRRLAMLIAPDKLRHRVTYRISVPIMGSRYYFALFFGKEKRSGERLDQEGQSRSIGSLLVRAAMVLWLMSSLVVAITLAGIFILYALKSILGVDLFDGHFFLHPLLFKLGLLPGSG